MSRSNRVYVRADDAFLSGAAWDFRGHLEVKQGSSSWLGLAIHSFQEEEA